MCAIQKLKIHLIVHYSNAISLWKGVPALCCHVQNISTASELRQAVIDWSWLVLWLNLELHRVESDFVRCQTTMRAFASRIELDWNRIVLQNALWILVFSTTRPWNKQISAPDVSQPSSQERWQVADLKHLKNSYLFSSEDKYKGFSLYQREDWLIDWNQLQLCQF